MNSPATEQSASGDGRVPREPWRIVAGQVPGIDVIEGPCFRISVVVSATDLDFDDYVKRRADMDLIAAAPDLLNALSGLYADHVDYLTLNKLGGMDNHWMKAARAALEKARGY